MIRLPALVLLRLEDHRVGPSTADRFFNAEFDWNSWKSNVMAVAPKEIVAGPVSYQDPVFVPAQAAPMRQKHILAS